MSNRLATVRERIEDVRKHTPPLATRKARRGYISKDDFAVLLGISRSRIYAWTRDTNPQYPEEESRQKLADVSEGRYSPDDFLPDEGEDEQLDQRIAALERQVERLERHIFGQGVSRAR